MKSRALKVLSKNDFDNFTVDQLTIGLLTKAIDKAEWSD